MKRRLAEAVVKKDSEPLLRQNTSLSMVGPEIGLTGINNLDTIIGGSYLALRPGTGAPAREFTVLSHPPGDETDSGGLHIILESRSLGSLKAGSPIYYRQVPVGMISGYRLSPQSDLVWIEAGIRPEYQHLIYKGTKFWNVSGIKVSGGVFSGMSVKTESMQSLIRGGVALATPEADQRGEKAANGDHFALAPKGEPGWRKWHPDLSTEMEAQPVTSQKEERKGEIIRPEQQKERTKATGKKKRALPQGE